MYICAIEVASLKELGLAPEKIGQLHKKAEVLPLLGVCYDDIKGAA